MTKSINIQSVPTNIITGFLGVGKTSTILHLLKNKPDDERWAILVNEFGEIGIDGSLLEGQTSGDGVFIREVPGGCMCCASGVPMQVALNQLLASAKPDRLLIEPTGLGHPKEVLEVLSSAYYQKVLSLQKTIALVDARKLSDERYTNHDTFNQQISIADTVVGNKVDRYEDKDREKLVDYVVQVSGADTAVVFAEYGNIDPIELSGKTTTHLKQRCQHEHEGGHTSLALSEERLPECGFVSAESQDSKGEGFQSSGWRFSSDFVFDKKQLIDFIWGLNADRIKAVFITSSGMVGLNVADGILTESVLTGINESRIEIISRVLPKTLEARLMSCLSISDR